MCSVRHILAITVSLLVCLLLASCISVFPLSEQEQIPSTTEAEITSVQTSADETTTPEQTTPTLPDSDFPNLPDSEGTKRY